jgi:hypothetical protein
MDYFQQLFVQTLAILPMMDFPMSRGRHCCAVPSPP